jgi:hypothetical protein
VACVMALKTMWKTRAAPHAADESGGAQTSGTFGAQPSTGNGSIAQAAGGRGMEEAGRQGTRPLPSRTPSRPGS